MGQRLQMVTLAVRDLATCLGHNPGLVFDADGQVRFTEAEG